MILQKQDISKDNKAENKNYSASYNEIKIGRTVYCVTSIFTGEKELGATLEKLAVGHVLSKINGKANEMLRS